MESNPRDTDDLLETAMTRVKQAFDEILELRRRARERSGETADETIPGWREPRDAPFEPILASESPTGMDQLKDMISLTLLNEVRLARAIDEVARAVEQLRAEKRPTD